MLTLRPLAQVKAFKPTVTKLFQPLDAALLALPAAAAATGGHKPDCSTEEADREAALLAALLEVYEWPDRHAGGISSHAPAYQFATGEAHMVLQPMVQLSALIATARLCTPNLRCRPVQLLQGAGDAGDWSAGRVLLQGGSQAALSCIQGGRQQLSSADQCEGMRWRCCLLRAAAPAQLLCVPP